MKNNFGKKANFRWWKKKFHATPLKATTSRHGARFKSHFWFLHSSCRKHYLKLFSSATLKKVGYSLGIWIFLKSSYGSTADIGVIIIRQLEVELLQFLPQ